MEVPQVFREISVSDPVPVQDWLHEVIVCVPERLELHDVEVPLIVSKLDEPSAEAGVPEVTDKPVAEPPTARLEVEPLAVPLKVLLPEPLRVIVLVVLSVPVEQVPVKEPA